jgi:phospholipid/cholesterol/gamma-HCH transport system substrate-binding protein
MRGHVRSALGAIICALMSTGCASLNINSIPLPGNDYQNGYDIVAEFANVLNLPDRAKVVMNGTTVGVVTKVSVASDHVDVTARIANDVQVPSNVKAILQQATVLGDIYLAINEDQGTDSAAPPLGPGGRIPVAQTTSPPQLEDTIANLANFIGSGSIQRAQNTIVQINQVTPPKAEVRRVVSQVTADLKGLSDNIDNVDLLLHSLSDTSTVLATQTPELRTFFTPPGIAGFKRIADSLKGISTILPSLGTIYNNGYWILPAFKALTEALGAAQGTKQAVEAEYPAYRDFIDNYLLRQDKYPAINITSIVGPDGRELSGNVEQVLRMLGAVP